MSEATLLENWPFIIEGSYQRLSNLNDELEMLMKSKNIVQYPYIVDMMKSVRQAMKDSYSRETDMPF